MAKKELKALAELHDANRERARFDRNLAFTTYPELFDPILLRPCVVRILIVTDSGGSFGNDDFGLVELLNILSVSPGPHVRFAVTKAHRQSDPAADVENFVFAKGSLDDYDELWMFAVSSSGELPAAERRVITEFMNAGGGVFATGDHEDLGVEMAGQVPRVRSMRKWYWPNPGPNGEPVAPHGSNEDRYDTLRQDADLEWHFDNQSDNIPQPIEPRWYGRRTGLFRLRYPHPLLCGPRGVIRILPDHAHEGECYEPSDLAFQYDIDGWKGDEYPPGASGTRIAPQVIAWATVIGGHPTDFKPPVNARRFGVIGAYDGHLASVGRVTVDATWHHFFNINLVGTPGGSSPVKQQGFHHPSTPPGLYDDIKAYFRNIAVWLAPPALQRCMRKRALWAARWKYPLIESLESAIGRKELDSARLQNIGADARETLAQIAGRCISLIWLLELLEVRELVHPWLPAPIEPDEDEDFDPGPVLDAAIGGALVELARRFPTRNEKVKAEAEEAVDEVVSSNARRFISDVFPLDRRLGKLVDVLNRMR